MRLQENTIGHQSSVLTFPLVWNFNKCEKVNKTQSSTLPFNCTLLNMWSFDGSEEHFKILVTPTRALRKRKGKVERCSDQFIGNSTAKHPACPLQIKTLLHKCKAATEKEMQLEYTHTEWKCYAHVHVCVHVCAACESNLHFTAGCWDKRAANRDSTFTLAVLAWRGDGLLGGEEGRRLKIWFKNLATSLVTSELRQWDWMISARSCIALAESDVCA